MAMYTTLAPRRKMSYKWNISVTLINRWINYSVTCPFQYGKPKIRSACCNTQRYNSTYASVQVLNSRPFPPAFSSQLIVEHLPYGLEIGKPLLVPCWHNGSVGFGSGWFLPCQFYSCAKPLKSSTLLLMGTAVFLQGNMCLQCCKAERPIEIGLSLTKIQDRL